jgi:hypothetical protein
LIFGLFAIADLASASTEHPYASPRQRVDNCSYPDASGHCPVVMVQAIEPTIRNSWARVRYPKAPTAYPSFAKREQYSAVRERLLKSGWRPASTADADQCIKGDGRCEGRPEMQACAGTGEANCNFRWRKANMVIDVSTINDTPVVTAISKCRNDCR